MFTRIILRIGLIFTRRAGKETVKESSFKIASELLNPYNNLTRFKGHSTICIHM